jgi:peptide/nickel transport system permease protein
MAHGWASYLARRLPQAVPVVLGIALLNFVVLQLAPGDVVDVMAGEAGAATPEAMAALRARFGLDQPLALQFWHYLQGLLSLDLGFSYRQNLPVFTLIMDRLPATLWLMGAALTMALLLGITLGVCCALAPGKWLDQSISLWVLLAYAMPTFWLGLMAMVVFAGKLGWLPSGGMLSLDFEGNGLARLVDGLRHLVLPSVTLATFYLAVYVKLVRNAMLEVLGSDFIRTARAKGVSPGAVLLRHALRNALLPLVTMLGYQVSALLGGAVLVESVFAWPGIGRLAFDAVAARDFNLLLGILLLSAVLVTLLNLLVDGVVAWLDPRIDLSHSRAL